MKPVFGIDITENKNNESMHAEKFVGAHVSEKQAAALDAARTEAEETLKRARLPMLLNIAKLSGLVLGGIATLSFLNVTSNLGFKAAFTHSPLMFFAGIIGIAAFIIISIIGVMRENRILEGGDATALAGKIRGITEKIHAELGVPKDAKNVDVLLFKYKENSGEITPKADPLSLTPYINFECKAFAKDGTLSLADLEQRYDFPQIDMRGIHTVNKRISVPTWNKPQHHTSEKYKKYNLTKNNMDCIFFKPYYILELVLDGESYGIYFPSYEIDTFKSLTDIHVIESEQM